jgi:hypothetical protein
MEKTIVKLACLAALMLLGGSLLGPRTARAQASRQQVEGLFIPPDKGYAVEKSWVSPGDWSGFGFWSLRDYGVPGTSSSDPFNFAYTKTSFSGQMAMIAVNATWDHESFPIPAPPGDRTDACAHAHVVWATWVRYTLPIFNGYGFADSAGAVGMRRNPVTIAEVDYETPGAICDVTSVPSTLNPIMNDFRWGAYGAAYTLDPRFNPEVIMAAQAVTHGWGGCGRFTCYPPVRFMSAIGSP